MPNLKQMIFNHFKWKLHQIQSSIQRDEHELEYLFLEVSRRCNISCRYCGSDCTNTCNSTELTTQQWLDIIDQIADDFVPQKVMIAVTGGEPLFRPDIFDIFKRLQERGFYYGMVSNSTLLNAETAERLVQCGIHSISLSCDSIPEINDKQRCPNASKHVVDAIHHLRCAKYRGILEILSTITKPCIPHLEEMKTWVQNLKIKRWRLAPVIAIGRAAENKDLLLDHNDIKIILDFIRDQRQSLDHIKVELTEEGFVGDEYEGLVRPYLCQCKAGINVGGIRFDGKIAACPEISQVFDQGDILNERFSEVWNNKYQDFRDRSWTHKLGPCQHCDKFKICQGGSLHLYENKSTPTTRCLHEMLKQCD
ncbi:MAG: radical SAM protein [Proteobacteria bacterium]|jgi:radical SAM protein with 4Fe4S-binding SPASM domain|nr:radical SAM protein [Pseudomonadota bacterium]